MSGASHCSEPTAEYVEVAEYAEEGDSWCAGRLGVWTGCLRGDADLLFCGDQDRLLRGDERPEGVPPRRRAPAPACSPASAAAAGSVLGMCVLVSSSAASSSLEGSNRGNGSMEEPSADVPSCAKPWANASLRLSGEGSTWRIVERVLYAVPGRSRSGEAGAVRGRICVARMPSASNDCVLRAGQF